jgi:UDP-GlcNAc3NAcA epimerase
MKVLSVVGARPQFIKAALLSEELARRNWQECLVNTGQHYDYKMSKVFFDELGIKDPEYNLEVGSASHAVQTALMMQRLEPVVLAEKPDWVIVFGDTNTTLAGALVAAKLKIPLAHVEAGLRSFDKSMPEEINRIVTDHVSQLLLAPTQRAADNLHREGIVAGVAVVGDLMIDLVHRAAASVRGRPLPSCIPFAAGTYGLATVHRASNTDDVGAFRRILDGISRLPFPVVFPVHPRTAPLVEDLPEPPRNILFCEPLSYLDMVAAEMHARVILTDSGGVQKEAYVLGVPCVTLRNTTEWTETLEDGWNVLAGTDPNAITAAVERSPAGLVLAATVSPVSSACRIVDLLEAASGVGGVFVLNDTSVVG